VQPASSSIIIHSKATAAAFDSEDKTAFPCHVYRPSGADLHCLHVAGRCASLAALHCREDLYTKATGVHHTGARDRSLLQNCSADSDNSEVE